MLSDKAKQLRLKLSEVFPILNERQRRVLAGSEARAYGRGGVTVVARITGMSRQTIYRGIEELGNFDAPDRVRRSGGGRKKLTDTLPDILEALEQMVDPTRRGDPESPLRWTCKSVRKIADSLAEQGCPIGRQSVANLLHELDYSLQANRKTSEGKQDHPDRDEQFKYINRRAKHFLRKLSPVISVDTKKKELIGRYKNEGHEWERKGQPLEVLSHDFPDPSVPKAVPYGVYDIGKDLGWVNVGMAADTAEFAVESINQWWKRMGKRRYSESTELYLCADSGSSNGYRIHLWKYELQKFCNRHNLKVTVSHYPPGTSKWNRIEHRLFSYITKNWRGRPLIDYRTVVELIASTTTKTGLLVKVRLDKKQYKKGKKVPAFEIEKLNIRRHKFHGEWNYTISPQSV
jgi:transposase